MDPLYLIEKEGRRRGLSERTISSYCYCVRKFMQFCRKEPRKVRKQDILDYLDHLVARGLSGSTLNINLNALKFLQQEILCKRILLRVKFSKRPKQMPIVLSKAEVVKLFAAVENPKHKLMIKLMYSAGLRLSELVNLKVEDIDFDMGVGWVRKGKGRKDRPFVLARSLAHELSEHIKECGSWLFEGRNKRHIHARCIQEIVKRAAKKAGIKKNVHPHSLRHSFATHLIENGYSVSNVQALLGHNSPQTTMVYVHIAKPKMLNIVSPIDRLCS